MPKYSKKILLILSLLVVITAVTVSIFEYLVKQGTFNEYVEQRINEKTGGEIKVGKIFIDLFSGIVLNDVAFYRSKNQDDADFKCKKLTLKYKLTELMSHHFRELKISQPVITFNLNQYQNFSKTPETVIYKSLKNLTTDYAFPTDYFIDTFQISNGTIHIENDNYQLTSLRTNLTTANVQATNPFDIELDGTITLSNTSTSTPLSIHGEYDTITKYHPKDNSITVSDYTALFIPDIGEFVVSGKIDSIFSGTETVCDLNINGLVFDHIPNLLKKCECQPDTLSDGECEISLKVSGHLTDLGAKTSAIFKEFKTLNM